VHARGGVSWYPTPRRQTPPTRQQRPDRWGARRTPLLAQHAGLPPYRTRPRKSCSLTGRTLDCCSAALPPPDLARRGNGLSYGCLEDDDAPA
jgi:hypothetical protein